MESRDQKTENGSQTGPSRLFCWSGGGFPGLDIHCGIWLALEAAGIVSTANAGTSAGAVMAALNSAGRSPHFVSAIIRGLSDCDVRRERLAWKLRIPWISSFLDPSPIRAILEENLPADFRELAKKLSVFATDEKYFSCCEFTETFPLIDAVMASMAIAGVFPPVKEFSDGGTTENLPLPIGWTNYDEVYLLVAKRPLEYCKNKSMLTRLLWNIDAMIENQVNDTIERAKASHPAVTVIRPNVDVPKGALHFDHSLIADSYRWAELQLEQQMTERKRA